MSVQVGQVWRDEDGLKWKVRALKDGWAYVTRYGYRTARPIQTNLAWFKEWTLLREAASPTTEGGEG